MRFSRRGGFTMAELLIVVAIIAVLVAVAIPVFNGQILKARVGTAKANLRSAYGQAMIIMNEENHESADPVIIRDVVFPLDMDEYLAHEGEIMQDLPLADLSMNGDLDGKTIDAAFWIDEDGVLAEIGKGGF